MTTPQRQPLDGAIHSAGCVNPLLSDVTDQVAVVQPHYPIIHPSLLQKMAQHRSFLSDPQSDTALATIDSDIASHFESIRQLCTKRNSLVPVSRLPPEVLANIFQHATQSDLSLGFALGSPAVWWIAITYVCRCWREVALATPSLWCSLPFHRPKWVPEMIARSKIAPLQVEVASESSRVLPQIRMALEHMPRIRVLGLELRASDFRTLPLTSPAPLLHTLKLFNWITEDPLPIPENAFDLVTPSLRQLELTGCAPSWDSPMFSGLTCLRLHTSFDLVSARPSFTRLPEILGSNPLLESLSLINCLPPVSTDSRPSSPPILLPMLTKLHLEGEALCCSLLVSSLSVPPIIALKLSSFASTSSRFTSLFASAKKLIISTSVLCLEISTSWTRATVTLKGYDRPFPSSHIIPEEIDTTKGASVHWDRTPHIEFCLRLSEVLSEARSECAEKILTEGCSLMDLTRLEEIHADTDVHMTKGTINESWWRRLFEKLQRVKTLTVSGRACFPALFALGKSVEQTKSGMETVKPGRAAIVLAGSPSRLSSAPTTRIGGPILLPNLTTLSINFADLDEAFYRSASQISAPFIDVLKKMLKWRKKYGKRVEKLLLGGCSHTDLDVLDGIWATVGDIGWDGEDCAKDESDEDYYVLDTDVDPLDSDSSD
ncbi:hypothetical protein JAAARDRAFT_203934 [Jaapia argillacea MUCL 33604]|uniref:F-box domain-containing protein n=1 Tax=Jaapia argillacea MUCL 33604 TaxID=933084 RepID=A0A067Q5L4_9AGAM|nr:hypothetical protein JAAARDRAFT_203934 [Jaapia argillacea MUCL 33604]